MSFGYLIITKATPILSKNRNQKFEFIDSIDDLSIYTRLDESQNLVIRENHCFYFSLEGMKLITDLSKPLYFMHFLLENRQSEYAIAMLAKKYINQNLFVSVDKLDREFQFNTLYKIYHQNYFNSL